MAVTFRFAPHNILRDTFIIEIVSAGKVVGAIYPEGERGVKLVSAHMTDVIPEEGFAGEVVEDDGSTSWPPIPAVLIQFSPPPYVIRGDKIVKLPPKE